MKKNILIALVAVFAFSSYATAEIHKWVDKSGTVHFSDAPSADKSVKSEVINVQNTNTIDSNISSSGSSYSSSNQGSTGKPNLSITSPSEQLVRENSGNVSVSATVSNSSGTITTKLLVDGQEQDSTTGNGTLSASFSNMDRGEHIISVVSEQNGNTVASVEKPFTLLRAHK